MRYHPRMRESVSYFDHFQATVGEILVIAERVDKQIEDSCNTCAFFSLTEDNLYQQWLQDHTQDQRKEGEEDEHS